MLNNPTIEKLQAMKFTGMLKGYLEQCEDPDCEALSFDERFGLLVDREAIERDSRRMQSRLRQAKLRLAATCGFQRIRSWIPKESDHLFRGKRSRIPMNAITCLCRSAATRVFQL